MPNGNNPDRDSGAFRVSTARLSSELRADSQRVADFATDILTGGLTLGQVAERMRTLAARLSQRSNAARNLEDVLEREQEVRRSNV